MKRIAIDMDEVIADYHTKHLAVFNRTFNESLSTDDVLGSRLRLIRPNLANEIIKLADDPSFFGDLDVIAGSQDVIRELSEHYEIFITTAAMEHPSSFQAKFEWLKNHFPNIDSLNYVFCGDKSIINADYLIDDNSRHFRRFRGQGILFTAPHNIHETGYVRVNSWQEVRDYFLSGVEKV
jgi:5'(3')-deoxyribonucleotidase